jgi:hypothetical protein
MDDATQMDVEFAGSDRITRASLNGVTRVYDEDIKSHDFEKYASSDSGESEPETADVADNETDAATAGDWEGTRVTKTKKRQERGKSKVAGTIAKKKMRHEKGEGRGGGCLTSSFVVKIEGGVKHEGAAGSRARVPQLLWTLLAGHDLYSNCEIHLATHVVELLLDWFLPKFTSASIFFPVYEFLYLNPDKLCQFPREALADAVSFLDVCSRNTASDPVTHALLWDNPHLKAVFRHLLEASGVITGGAEAVEQHCEVIETLRLYLKNLQDPLKLFSCISCDALKEEAECARVFFMLQPVMLNLDALGSLMLHDPDKTIQLLSAPTTWVKINTLCDKGSTGTQDLLFIKGAFKEMVLLIRDGIALLPHETVKGLRARPWVMTPRQCTDTWNILVRFYLNFFNTQTQCCFDPLVIHQHEALNEQVRETMEQYLRRVEDDRKVLAEHKASEESRLESEKEQRTRALVRATQQVEQAAAAKADAKKALDAALLQVQAGKSMGPVAAASSMGSVAAVGELEVVVSGGSSLDPNPNAVDVLPGGHAPDADPNPNAVDVLPGGHAPDADTDRNLEDLRRSLANSERVLQLANVEKEGAQVAAVSAQVPSVRSNPLPSPGSLVPAAVETPPTLVLSEGPLPDGLAAAVSASMMWLRPFLLSHCTDVVMALAISPVGPTVVRISQGTSGVKFDLFHVPSRTTESGLEEPLLNVRLIIESFLDGVHDRSVPSRHTKSLTCKLDKARSSNGKADIEKVVSCLGQDHVAFVCGDDDDGAGSALWRSLKDQDRQASFEDSFEITTTILPAVSVGTTLSSQVLPLLPALAVFSALARGYGHFDVGLFFRIQTYQVLTLAKTGPAYYFAELCVPRNLASRAEIAVFDHALLLGWAQTLTGGNIPGCVPNLPGAGGWFIPSRQNCANWLKCQFQGGMDDTRADVGNTSPQWMLGVYNRYSAPSLMAQETTTFALDFPLSKDTNSFGGIFRKAENSRGKYLESRDVYHHQAAVWASDMLKVVDLNASYMFGITTPACEDERKLYLQYSKLPVSEFPRCCVSTFGGSVLDANVRKFTGVLAPNPEQLAYLSTLTVDDRELLRNHALFLIEFFVRICSESPDLFVKNGVASQSESISALRGFSDELTRLSAPGATAAGQSHSVDEQRRTLCLQIKKCCELFDYYNQPLRRFLDFGFNCLVYPAYRELAYVITLRQKKKQGNKAAMTVLEKRSLTYQDRIQLAQAHAKEQLSASSYPTAEAETAVLEALCVGRVFVGGSLRQGREGLDVVYLDDCVPVGASNQLVADPVSVKIALIGLVDADPERRFALDSRWLDNNISPDGFVVVEVLTQSKHAFVIDGGPGTTNIAGIVFLLGHSSWNQYLKGSLVGRQLSSLEPWMGRTSLQTKMIELDVNCDLFEICDGQFPLSWISIPRIHNLMKMGKGADVQWKRGNAVISGLICPNQFCV